MAICRARLLISGRVQGVWFRQSTKNQADRHQVVGWCRNNPDGTVAALFEGPESAVQALIDWCREGPELARVTHVEIDWETPTGEFSRFRAL